jgi:hypothetical protein
MKNLFSRSSWAALSLLIASTAQSQIFVTSTMLPLEITQSGLYVVAEPLTFAGPGDAITVQTNHVTIDLNGFTLTGPDAGAAIQQDEEYRALVVINGTLTGWGTSVDTAAAIFARGANNRFSHLRIHASEGGIYTGENAVIEHCRISDIAHASEAFGIQAETGSRIMMCLIEGVVAPLSYGIVGFNAVRVERCIVTGIGAGGTTDQALGIALSSGSVVDSSVSAILGAEYAAGIGVDDMVSVESSTVSSIFSSDQTEGIRAVPGSQIVRSVIGPIGDIGNTGAAVILTGARLADSVVHHAGHSGIHAETGSRVENSVSVFHSKFAAAEAVRLIGPRNHIEGNLLATSLAPVTWSAADTNSVIIRNAAYDNDIGLATADNHRANTLIAPGVDFNHATRSYYFENVQW